MYNKNVVIIACKRTPIGMFKGSLSSFTAPNLGSMAIQGALASAFIDSKEIEEVVMGEVLQASVGQAPARQAAIEARLPISTPCTTINKGCASGMKSVIFGAQMIASGSRKIVIAGGMESMTGSPHYTYIRGPIQYAHSEFADSILKDGYTFFTDKFESYLNEYYRHKEMHIGKCAENTIKELGISRKDLDEWTKTTYERARNSQAKNIFDWEIVDIVQDTHSGKIKINQDEECKRYMPDLVSKLNPIYSNNGFLTAASSSKLSDGGSAIILSDKEHAANLGYTPLARIIGYHDSAVDFLDFTKGSAKVTNEILHKVGMNLSDIDYHEINETYSSIPLATALLLSLSLEKVNLHGGAVSLGHPLGMSGNRVIMSLLNVLREKGASVGLASVCNGGGGASAVIIERIN